MPFPAGTGIRPLPVPNKAPRSEAQRLFLATVLYVIGRRRSQHVSQRELQQLLNRAGRGSVTTNLRLLREGRFLRRKTVRRNRTDADSYMQGPALKGSDVDQWRRLANRLFGESGICRGLLGHPAFGTRFLGANGMLVIGILRRSRRPLKVSELHLILRFFISSEGTVRNQLNKAKAHGLVNNHGEHWSIAGDHEDRLHAYVEGRGPGARQARVRHQHARERDLFAIRLRSGVLSVDEEDVLRSKGCVRCRKSNKQCRIDEGKRLTIEHFPPKKWLSGWRMKDHPRFNYAVCPSENYRYGAMLRTISPPTLHELVDVTVRHESDIGRLLDAKLPRELRRFYKALDAGELAAAGLAAARAASFWIALSTDRPLKTIRGLHDADHVSAPTTGPTRHRRTTRPNLKRVNRTVLVKTP